MKLPISFTALTLGLILTGQLTYAQETIQDRSEWSYNDHWENTQIEYEKMIFGTINQSTCTKSIKEFMGCMAVLNKTYEMMFPKQNLLVTYAPEKKESEMVPFDVIEYLDINREEFFNIKRDYFQSLYHQYEGSFKNKSLLVFNPDRILNGFTEKMVTEANDQMMAGTLYNEYLALAYDPHTYIYPKTYLEDVAKPKIRKKGIGIYFHIESVNGSDHYILDEVIDKSPADKYGLQSGDVILKANKAQLTKEIYKVISDSDTITFDILRREKNIKIDLVKEFYEVSQVQTSVLTRNNKKYGYIKLRTFTDQTACQRITKAGKKMIDEDHISGLVLDLRNNGGGLVTQMQCIVKLYLEDGSRIWAVKYLDQDYHELIEEKVRHTNNIFGDMHTVILINGRSASASEATSIYLKDYRKSFIVGERSFGKGSMQEIAPIKEAPSILKGSTKALYYGPKGISPQAQGVKPDFVAFPKIEQTKATPMTRESDRYLLVLENKVTQADLVDTDRKEEIATINDCMAQTNAISTRYQNIEKYKQRIFDNQLETGLEVIACANQHVEIYNKIDIQIADGVEFIDKMEYFRKMFNEKKTKRNF